MDAGRGPPTLLAPARGVDHRACRGACAAGRGWWTWVHAGLSLVLLTGTLLVGRWPRMTATGR